MDASVAVKWVMPEHGSENADRLLGDGEPLLAPDLVLVEAANALWKKVTRREVSVGEARRALQMLRGSALETRPTAPLLGRALDLATQHKHPVYDCIYVALAEAEGARLVSADARLLTAGARRLRWPVAVVDLATI
ncbi:MAG: type II toxin-antitoxin system VapC family toxin [Candidatus Rokuibacteriota bacterium]